MNPVAAGLLAGNIELARGEQALGIFPVYAG